MSPQQFKELILSGCPACNANTQNIPNVKAEAENTFQSTVASSYDANCVSSRGNNSANMASVISHTTSACVSQQTTPACCL